MKNRTLQLFRTGAWCWVIAGVGHSILEAVRLTRPTPETTPAITTAMRAHTVNIGGLPRNMQDLLTGFSLTMGFALALTGVLFLVLARAVPQLIEDRTGLTALGLGASLTVLTVAVLLLPTPPIFLFTVASLSHGLSLLVRRRPRHAAPR
jgi:hypothetical protein